MANASSKSPSQPMAFHDFAKSNGVDASIGPGGPSLTRQEFAEECDINSIMRRYETVGAGPGGLPRDPRIEPFYADFTTMPTNLLEYMELMEDAQKSFMSLPAHVRREFDNDPVAFVEYAQHPANLGQMQEWGLAPRPAEPAQQPPGGPSGPVGSSPGSSSQALPPAQPAASTHGST